MEERKKARGHVRNLKVFVMMSLRQWLATSRTRPALKTVTRRLTTDDAKRLETAADWTDFQTRRAEFATLSPSMLPCLCNH